MHHTQDYNQPRKRKSHHETSSSLAKLLLPFLPSLLGPPPPLYQPSFHVHPLTRFVLDCSQPRGRCSPRRLHATTRELDFNFSPVLNVDRSTFPRESLMPINCDGGSSPFFPTDWHLRNTAKRIRIATSHACNPIYPIPLWLVFNFSFTPIFFCLLRRILTTDERFDARKLCNSIF